jgi:deoxyribodipyrimidine photolyase-related protein
MQIKTLRLILGDQLNENHLWYQKVDSSVLYCLMEIRSETDYVVHHIQKIAAIFASMRNLAQKLEAQGHRVHYIKISDEKNLHYFAENLKSIFQTEKIEKFEYQAPDEFRVDEHLKKFCESLTIACEMVDTEHFLTSRSELAQLFVGKKTYLMETFYRKIRTKFNIMMEDGKPVGNQWNFDHENRNKYKGEIPIPVPEVPQNNVAQIVNEIDGAGVKYIGTINPENMIWPINKAQSINMLTHFCTKALPAFGTYQDAMLKNDWTLFHSRLSFSMNVKMLHPLEVVNAAIAEWEKRPDEISLSQIEGFMRQIVGWREYMRGVYWAHMPDYALKNFFNHTEKLPEWYWTGNTKMTCLSKAIQQSLSKAYAHHIQRLMVTGNFALLAGINPDEVDAWYLGIYIDAFEWVEITNTRGMSQFADGGIVGTKPYVSSANYIDKMSDYCEGCHYDKKVKHGPKACPFNSFYWHFYDRNRDKLERNPRIGMMYRTWDKMDSTEKNKILNQADIYLSKINDL